MIEANIAKDRVKFEKDLELLKSKLEFVGGFRLLMAFQCLKCGRVSDVASDAIEHSVICKVSEVVIKDDIRNQI